MTDFLYLYTYCNNNNTNNELFIINLSFNYKINHTTTTTNKTNNKLINRILRLIQKKNRSLYFIYFCTNKQARILQIYTNKIKYFFNCCCYISL